ncbi:hypothetical protein BDV95DRAFT_489355, partial [Massariosphaeria phaeospora]
PIAQSTGGALLNSDPTQTVVVSISPPPGPPRERNGISSSTEHLLIAAGSIGATMIIVMIIFAIYTMRKRNLSFTEVVLHAKRQFARRARPAAPPKQTESTWDTKPSYDENYGYMQDGRVAHPQATAAVARSGSSSSQRPLTALQRSDSFTRQPGPDRSVSPETIPRSFNLDSHGHNNNSVAPSSSALPTQKQRRSESTHNTRSLSDGSDLVFPNAPQDRSLSPLPAPPTFKQFMNNRPEISSRAAPGGPMISRFSWTNSNAPLTPHDPARDTNTHIAGRDSFMTQRSSVPRFRTVDSWVDQQTNRIETQKLKEQFRMTQSTTCSEDDKHYTIPEVPDLPANMEALRESSDPNASTVQTPKVPMTPLPPSAGLPGKNVKHERHDTRTTVDTAPIFKQHPGTEVRFSVHSEVPSEILNKGCPNNVLS